MSTLGSTARSTAEAVVDRVYEPNKVPPKPVYPYAEVSSSGWLPEAYSLDNSHGLRDFQLVIRVFGRGEDSVDAVMGPLLDLFVDAYVGEYGPGRLTLSPQPLARDADDNGVLGSIATLNFSKETA